MSNSSCTDSRGKIKVRYRNNMQAIGAAIRTSKGTGKAMRIYLCPDCHYWHTTKRLKK